MRSNKGRPRRDFTAEEDALILAWCGGEIGLFECVRKVRSSVPTVKNRAALLCAKHLNLAVPKHKSNKNYKYFGKEDDPIDYNTRPITVGSDNLLRKLQEGLR